ncbi:MAG: hypothetical protein QM638_13610 [Nocardioides sp.]|uniref:hypothetical protein n=1 Tax=Nocardioides sp. TaxID=35761 RepID=UPI0039E3A1D8
MSSSRDPDDASPPPAPLPQAPPIDPRTRPPQPVRDGWWAGDAVLAWVIFAADVVLAFFLSVAFGIFTLVDAASCQEGESCGGRSGAIFLPWLVVAVLGVVLGYLSRRKVVIFWIPLVVGLGTLGWISYELHQ